jgi:hypothetical protein
MSAGVFVITFDRKRVTVNVSNTPIYLNSSDKEKLKKLSSMFQRTQSDTVRVLIRGAFQSAQQKDEHILQILSPIIYAGESETLSKE